IGDGYKKGITISPYAKVYLNKVNKNYIQTIIPPGTRVLPESETMFRLPRQSMFEYASGTYIYVLPTKYTTSPTKQKTSPTKQKAPTTTQTQTVVPHKQYHPESAIYVNKKHAVMLKEQIDY